MKFYPHALKRRLLISHCENIVIEGFADLLTIKRYNNVNNTIIKFTNVNRSTKHQKLNVMYVNVANVLLFSLYLARFVKFSFYINYMLRNTTMKS